MDSDYEIVTEISKMATTIAAKDTEKVALVIDVWKGGGRGGRRMKTSRSGPRAVMASVPVSPSVSVRASVCPSVFHM